MKSRLTMLSAVLAAFILTGALCDKGGGPSGPSIPYDEYVTQNLPGTWNYDWDSEDVDLYATLNTSQQTVDNTRPGSGSISVSGAVSGNMSYCYAAYSGMGEAVCVVVSFPDNAESYPAMGLVYEKMQGETDIALIYVTSANDQNEQYFTYTSGTCTYDGATNTLTVSELVLTNQETGATVTCNGTFIPAFKTLTAGLEHNLGDTWYEAAPSTMVFNSDSTVRIDGQTGTWSVVGNKVMVVIGGDTTYYSMIISGNILTITVNEDVATAWPYTPEPLDEIESDFGFAAGSITSARVAGTIRYDRSTVIAKEAQVALRSARRKLPGAVGRFMR